MYKNYLVLVALCLIASNVSHGFSCKRANQLSADDKNIAALFLKDGILAGLGLYQRDISVYKGTFKDKPNQVAMEVLGMANKKYLNTLGQISPIELLNGAIKECKTLGEDEDIFIAAAVVIINKTGKK